jgi:soluble lytic murein transglycosylase-like protein
MMRCAIPQLNPLVLSQWIAAGLLVCLSGLAHAKAERSAWIDTNQESKRIYPVESPKTAETNPTASTDGMKLIWPTARPAQAKAQPLLASGEAAPLVARTRPARPATTTAASRATPLMLRTMVQASQRFKVDAYLIKAVIHAESAFNPLARSPKNAIGLMQVLAGTAQDMGLSAQPDASVEQLLTDPRVSIVVGTKYLAEQLNRFDGSVELALAAYNAGPGAVIKSGTKVPPYRETKAYVKRVMALAQGYRQGQSLQGVAL